MSIVFTKKVGVRFSFYKKVHRRRGDLSLHPRLKPRKDTYQDFLPRICRDGITITGVRTAESVQRLNYMAAMTSAGKELATEKNVGRKLSEKNI